MPLVEGGSSSPCVAVAMKLAGVGADHEDRALRVDEQLAPAGEPEGVDLAATRREPFRPVQVGEEDPAVRGDRLQSAGRSRPRGRRASVAAAGAIVRRARGGRPRSRPR